MNDEQSCLIHTDHGPLDMFKNIPIEAEEIEEIMHSGVMA